MTKIEFFESCKLWFAVMMQDAYAGVVSVLSCLSEFYSGTYWNNSALIRFYVDLSISIVDTTVGSDTIYRETEVWHVLCQQ